MKAGARALAFSALPLGGDAGSLTEKDFRGRPLSFTPHGAIDQADGASGCDAAEPAVQLDDAHLARYAEEVGVDGARVLSDLDTGRFEETVEVDFVEGVRMGVNGTPTSFINGVRFDGDWRDIVRFAAAVEQVAAEPMPLVLGLN